MLLKVQPRVQIEFEYSNILHVKKSYRYVYRKCQKWLRYDYSFQRVYFIGHFFLFEMAMNQYIKFINKIFFFKIR